MRFTAILRAIRKPPVNPNLVDSFGAPKRAKKAWDGQDKDKFFRDKYAHVHAKQLKLRKEEQQAKKERDTRKAPKPAPVITRKRPENDFAEKLEKRMAKQPDLEYVYGTGPVKAVLETRRVSRLFFGNALSDIDSEILARCSELEIPILHNTPLQHMNIMSTNGVHNKYIAETRKREFEFVKDIEIEDGKLQINDLSFRLKPGHKHPIGVYLDEITDTHNLGAILRSAYWMGVDFVAVSSRNSAPLNPAVIKASAGASEFVQMLKVSQPLNLFEKLSAKGWAVVATCPVKNTTLKSVQPDELAALRENQPCLLVIGSEGEGLRTSLIQRSTHSVTLPSAEANPRVDSLNVSVATALLLSKLMP